MKEEEKSDLSLIAPEKVLLCDYNGKILDRNPEGKTVFTGRENITEIIIPEERSFLANILKALKKNASTIQKIFHLENGRTIHITLTSLKNRVLAIVRDFALPSDIWEMASLAEANPDPVIAVQRSGNLVYFNPAVQNFFPAFPLYQKEHPLMEKIKESLRTFTGNKKVDSRNLEWENHVYEQKVIQVDENLFRVDYHDITPMRKAEKKLVNSWENLSSIIHKAPIGICITNEKGTFEFVNETYCKIYGYKADELIGKHFTIVVPDELKEFMDKYHERFIKRKTELKGEWKVVNKKGKTLNIMANAAWILGQDGGPKKVTFVVDITRRKESEAKLKKYTREIEQNLQEKQRGLLKARQIQLNLIPGETPKLESARLAAFYIPCEEVSGDFYDFLYCPSEKRLGIFISDVSGHGIPSALITSMIKILLQTVPDKYCEPAELLKFINKRIMGLLNGNFLTAFYGYYREEDKTFHYARAGHNYPYLVRNGEIIPLTGKGKVLGVFEDEEFEEHTILLHRGDKILFYTDGLMEAANEKEVEFETVLPELLKKHISLPVENLVSEIYKEVVAFQGSEKFEDDVCLIGMEVE